jgi:spore maturation protein CgeB
MSFQIQTEYSRDNKPVPSIDGFIIHSKYSPEIEGKKLSDPIINKNLPPDTPILILGLGYAYHFLDLIDKFNHVYIAESISALIESAKTIDHMKPVFQKCRIIESIEKTPYLENFEIISLRSEFRFQERFFNDVIQKASIKSSDRTANFNELRILVDFPIYGGSYTTAEYTVQALKDLGCQVETMDNAIADPMLQYMLKMEKYQNAVIPKLNELMSDLLWEKFLSFKPHIVFCLAQAPISQHLINAIRQSGSIVAFWFVEDFRRFPYWNDVIKYIDYFFVIQKGEFSNQLKEFPQTISRYLPMACSPQIHLKLPKDAIENEYSSDISFMGAAFANRVNFFSHFTDYNLKLFGTGWNDYNLFKNNCMFEGRRISIPESVKIYNASKININLHSSNEDNLFDQYGDFINPRTFEICSCGAFQLTDDREALREFFTPGLNIETFSTIEEAKDKINYYLIHENERLKIAKKGQELVYLNHTYKHRMSEALNTIQSNSPLLRDKVEKEQLKVQQIMNMINDKDFSELMKNINPAMRNSYEYIIREIKKNQGSLKDYEAILLLMESFINGE